MAARILAPREQGHLLRAGVDPVNTFQFFNEHFGKFLTEQTNQPHMDTWRALSSNHLLQKKNSAGGDVSNRLTSGWAIVRPSGTVMQQKLAAGGIQYDDRTRFEAFADELAAWDGNPRIFLMFDKAPIPIANIFITSYPSLKQLRCMSCIV